MAVGVYLPKECEQKIGSSAASGHSVGESRGTFVQSGTVRPAYGMWYARLHGRQRCAAVRNGQVRAYVIHIPFHTVFTLRRV